MANDAFPAAAVGPKGRAQDSGAADGPLSPIPGAEGQEGRGHSPPSTFGTEPPLLSAELERRSSAGKDRAVPAALDPSAQLVPPSADASAGEDRAFQSVACSLQQEHEQYSGLDGDGQGATVQGTHNQDGTGLRDGTGEGASGARIPVKAAVNVVLLALCFGLGWAELFIQVSGTTVAAKNWGGTALSLVPYGLFAATHALWAVPAQILMKRHGPRPFYLLGALAGAVGNAIMIGAALQKSFALLCVGAPFCGFANAYVNFLRFEAARFVSSPRSLPLAISTVIFGGVLGGALGPLITRFTRNTSPNHEFLVTYAIAVAVWGIEALLVSLVAFDFHPHAPVKTVSSIVISSRDSSSRETVLENGKLAAISTAASQEKGVPEAAQLEHALAAAHTGQQNEGACAGSTQAGAYLDAANESASPGSRKPAKGGGGASLQQSFRTDSLADGIVEPRPWHHFLRDRTFVVAVMAATVCYTFMAVFMLTGVIAMTAVQPGTYVVDLSGPSNQAITFADTSNVIIAHVEAMFIPSFFSGFIIRVIGADGSMLAGFVVLVLAEFLLLLSAHLWNFFLTMVLIGLGWNLAFVGATAALATTYRPNEKDLAQGMNDAVTFGVNTFVTITASLVLHAVGDWNTFVLIYSCLTLPGLAASAWYFLTKRVKGEPSEVQAKKRKRLLEKGSVTSRFRLIAR